jgi:transcriptional regulator with XRE-family HTH domain
MRRATAQQVADRAGVSISAVSRAFTPGASVSASTLARVMKAANALGYQPNVMARSLMTGRTALIGLVSNNFDNPAFMEIFDLFTRKLQEHGLRPLLANLSGSSDPAHAVAMMPRINPLFMSWAPTMRRAAGWRRKRCCGMATGNWPFSVAQRPPVQQRIA